MAFFGLWKTKKAGFWAVVDVGTHSIKAVTFQKSAGSDRPRVLKKMVLRLPFSQDEVSGSESAEKYSEGVEGKLHELLFAMVREFERIPERILVALGTTYAEAGLETWQIGDGKTNRIMTRKEIGAYVSALVDARKRTEGRFILAYPVGIFANGYEVGFDVAEKTSASHLAVRVLLLSFSAEFGTRLMAIRQSLGGMPIEFFPLIVAEQSALVRKFQLDDVLLVDIGGEGTTVSLLRHGGFAFVTSFPLGGRHFIKGISKIASVSPEEAEDVKRQYAQGIVDEWRRNKLSEFLSSEGELWEKLFIEALGDCYQVGPIPPRVLMMGGGASIPEIFQIMREGAWSKDFSYAVPQVQVLSAHAFFDGDTLDGFLQGPEDVGIASLIYYAFHHESWW